MSPTDHDYAALVREALLFSFPSVVARHDIMGELPEPATFNLVHIITGIRRSGKTFYAFQLIERLLASGVPRNRVFYFNFADDRLRPASATLLNDVVEEYWRQVPEARTQGCYLFLDEVQEAEGWQGFCQRTAEHERVTLVITGSSSKLSADGIATQFRGRSQEHAMFPLSFGEYRFFPRSLWRGSAGREGRAPSAAPSPATRSSRPDRTTRRTSRRETRGMRECQSPRALSRARR